MASWSVCPSPDRAVRVLALTGDIVLCSWARYLTLTVPLSIQVYKWVPANLMLGVTLRWTSIPSRGSRNTPRLLVASCYRNRDSLMGYLDRVQTLPYLETDDEHFVAKHKTVAIVSQAQTSHTLDGKVQRLQVLIVVGCTSSHYPLWSCAYASSIHKGGVCKLAVLTMVGRAGQQYWLVKDALPNSTHYSLWWAGQSNRTYSGGVILLGIPLEPQKVCFYWYFLTPEPAVHPQQCRRVFPLSMYPFPIHLRL